MTKARAIKVHCFDCAGETSKEVTLCVVFDCPLWPYRTGSSSKSNTYRKRMETAIVNYAEDLKRMAAEGYQVAKFSESIRPTAVCSKKLPKSAPRARVTAGDGIHESGDT
jgi:hypothetical protein